MISVISIVALGALCVFFGFNLYQSHRDQQRADHFVVTARQGALNLTTIGHTTAERDVARILDSSTAHFHDDFQSRSEDFIELVEQAKTDTVGTVTGAGIESMNGDRALVLVSVSVETSNAAAPPQRPKLWRMRVEIQRDGPRFAVSNVTFVP